MAPTWSRLIRFISNETTYYGDVVLSAADNADDIISLAKERKLQARIIYNDPLSTQMVLSDNVVTVDRLLSPLTASQVPVIRCVGLNYVKHSTVSPDNF